MESDESGKDIANRGNRSMSDYGQRAAFALERLVPGPNRDKAIERLFNVSNRMARYLRAGQYWTAERLSEASRLLEDFDAYLASPDLHTRLDALERELAEIRQHINRGGGDE